MCLKNSDKITKSLSSLQANSNTLTTSSTTSMELIRSSRSVSIGKIASKWIIFSSRTLILSWIANDKICASSIIRFCRLLSTSTMECRSTRTLVMRKMIASSSSYIASLKRRRKLLICVSTFVTLSNCPTCNLRLSLLQTIRSHNPTKILNKQNNEKAVANSVRKISEEGASIHLIQNIFFFINLY